MTRLTDHKDSDEIIILENSSEDVETSIKSTSTVRASRYQSHHIVSDQEQERT